jgi:hypothetical protein
MRIPRLFYAAACASLAGCVFGSGPCLFLQPFKSDLTGTLHFRTYPFGDGMDQVPILALDKTAYVYDPAVSHLCLPANDVQLVGWTEFPPNLVDQAHLVVSGSLFEAATARQHTRFVLDVQLVSPLPALKAPPGSPAATRAATEAH